MKQSPSFYNLSVSLYVCKKGFYTRDTIRGIRISPLAKIRFHDWLRGWIMKRVNYLCCREGKRDLINISYITQNAALLIFIRLKISFVCYKDITLALQLPPLSNIDQNYCLTINIYVSVHFPYDLLPFYNFIIFTLDKISAWIETLV